MSWHSVDVDGFGVCFELGKKCYRMRTLYIPSLWKEDVAELLKRTQAYKEI